MKIIFHGIKAVFQFFTFSRGRFQPVYFWATLFNTLIATTWVMKLCQQKIPISDSLLLGLLTFVLAWLGVYNWYRVKTESAPPVVPSTASITGPAATVIKNAADISTQVVDKLKRGRK